MEMSATQKVGQEIKESQISHGNDTERIRKTHWKEREPDWSI